MNYYKAHIYDRNRVLCITVLEPRMIAVIIEPAIICCCTRGKRNITKDIIDAQAANIIINKVIENLNM